VAARVYLLRCYPDIVYDGPVSGPEEGVAAFGRLSEGSAVMPNRIRAKKSFGAELIEDMKAVVAHQRGLVELDQVWPKPIDVRAFGGQVKMPFVARPTTEHVKFCPKPSWKTKPRS
jgi:hypothetical protein